eukprot:gene26039-biopygen13230
MPHYHHTAPPSDHFPMMDPNRSGSIPSGSTMSSSRHRFHYNSVQFMIYSCHEEGAGTEAADPAPRAGSA